MSSYIPEFRIYQYFYEENRENRFKVMCHFPGGFQERIVDNLYTFTDAGNFLKIFIQGYRFHSQQIMALFELFEEE